MTEIDIEKLKEYCFNQCERCQNTGERIIAKNTEDRLYWYGQSLAYLYIITCINRGDFNKEIT